MSEDLATIIERAAAAAAKVPEHLQEAAFNRAFDYLTGDGDDNEPAQRQQRRTTRRSTRSQTKETPDSPPDPGANLVSQFDRTKVPDITTDTAVLDRSLMILRAAHDDYGVDGLTAPQIADILTGNLRVKTQRQHVNRALDAATRMVARRKEGRKVIYRIMEAGEDFLDAGGSDAEKETAAATPRRTTRRKRGAATQSNTGDTSQSSSTVAKSGSEAASTRRRGGSGRPGPKAAVEWLLEQGFLKDPRTIREIQDQLAHKRGHQYKVTDLSPTLVRLLRDNRLDRDRDDAGHYRYSAA
jgi:hypothetical protein